MKAKKAKVNKILSATACLAVSLVLATFSCFAWFTSNKTVNYGLNANVDGDFITDFTYTTYALTGKTESDGTTTYTVGEAYESDEEGYFSIASYGSSEAEATLLVLNYNVKDGKSTKLTFNGNSANPSIEIKDDGEDSEGNPYDYVQTYLSNAISMRLLDSQNATYTKGDNVSSSKLERCFMDSTADNAKQEVIFNSVKAKTDYSVTLNILIEYDDDNVTALYDMNESAYLSMPIGFYNDLSLEIEAADDHGDNHTYSKWTVTEYTADDIYAYRATRTCTQCSDEEIVYIKELTDIGTVTVTTVYDEYGNELTGYTVTFSVAAASSGSSSGDSSHTHTYGSPSWTWADDYSTATATFTCTSNDDTQTIDATVTSVASGCTTTYTATASFNDSTYTDVVDITNHTESSAVIENYVAATCTTDGSYDTVVYCYVCGEEISRTTTTIPATGHTYENGTCTVCGATQPTSFTIDYGKLGAGTTVATSGTTYYNSDGTIASSSASWDGIISYENDATKTVTSSSLTVNGVTYTGYMNTGGNASIGSGRYYKIDLSNYVGKKVTITVVYASNSDTEARGVIISTGITSSTSSTSDISVLTYGTSSSKSDGQSLTYTISEISDITTYYICSYKSTNIYYINVSTE